MPEYPTDAQLYPEPKHVFWVHCWMVRHGRVVRFWHETEAEAREGAAYSASAGNVVTRVLGPDGEDLTKAWGYG